MTPETCTAELRALLHAAADELLARSDVDERGPHVPGLARHLISILPREQHPAWLRAPECWDCQDTGWRAQPHQAGCWAGGHGETCSCSPPPIFWPCSCSKGRERARESGRPEYL